MPHSQEKLIDCLLITFCQFHCVVTVVKSVLPGVKKKSQARAGGVCVKDLEGSLRYPMAKEGVYATGGHVCLAHTRQRVSNIVDLTVLRLAFFMGYELNKLVQWF